MNYATDDLHWRNAHRARARELTARTRTLPPAAQWNQSGCIQGEQISRGFLSRKTARHLPSPGHSNSGSTLAMQAMAVEFPQVHGHPNRLPFEGVLTLVDVPSDRAPSGARGHRVILTRAAAEAALPSLLGMAVDYKSPRPGDPVSAGWDGHDARQKCGIITAAELDGRRLTVAGFVFSRDFPEIEQRLAADRAATQDCHSERAHRANEESPHLFSDPAASSLMGMSYELADAHVADMSASVWTLTRATFTGAAILLRDKAAYRDTSFRLQQVSRSASQQVSARAWPQREPAPSSREATTSRRLASSASASLAR